MAEASVRLQAVSEREAAVQQAQQELQELRSQLAAKTAEVGGQHHYDCQPWLSASSLLLLLLLLLDRLKAASTLLVRHLL
jgi:phage-related minor tail protein